jgi:hypothetical protein
MRLNEFPSILGGYTFKDLINNAQLIDTMGDKIRDSYRRRTTCHKWQLKIIHIIFTETRKREKKKIISNLEHKRSD